MKTMTKRIASMALAVTMAVVMLASAVPTKAFAADPTGSLTVNGPAGMKGKKVYAVKMFDSEGAQDTGFTYKLNTAWGTFFQDLDETTMNGLSGDALSAAAYDYVLNLKDTAVVEFAKEAVDYARGTGKDTLFSLTTTAQADASGTGATATFTSLAYGYYLVYPAQGSTSVDRRTDAMLVNIPKNDEWNIKSEYPTVDKSIVENPTGGLDGIGDPKPGVNGQSANVGDTLTFKLESTVPDMTGYTDYTFKLHDILSKGLTLLDSVANPKVVVKIDGKKLDGANFTASATTEQSGGTKLTIDLSTYLTANKLFAGKKIEVYYQVKVNVQAVIENPNTNDAYVEYTTEPGKTENGVHDKTSTYTFGFTLDKRAGAEDGKALAGAEFKVHADANGNGAYDAGVDTVVKFSQGTGDNSGKWVVSENGQDTLTTPANGKLELAGFAAGTYFVEETKAPKGYNKLNAPIKVVISAEVAEDGSLTSHVIDYGDQANGQTDDRGTTTNHDGGHSIVIVNKAGTQLPETGGMGTILFTLVGAAAIGYGIYRKRTAKTVA